MAWQRFRKQHRTSLFDFHGHSSLSSKIPLPTDLPALAKDSSEAFSKQAYSLRLFDQEWLRISCERYCHPPTPLPR